MKFKTLARSAARRVTAAALSARRGAAVGAGASRAEQFIPLLGVPHRTSSRRWASPGPTASRTT